MYGDYNDPNRRPDGTFHNVYGTNATHGDQYQAGVNSYDSPFSASLKVQNDRFSRGLDPYTGLARVEYAGTAGGYSGTYSGGGSGTSVFRPDHLTPEQQALASEALRESNDRLGRNLGRLARWFLVYPVLAIAGFFLAWGSLRAVDAAWMQATPSGGVVRMALEKTFPGAELPPVSAFATPREIAAAMTPEALFAGAATPLTRANASQKVAQGDARREWLDLSAYLCQVDAGCREKALKTDPALAANVFNWSVEYLIEKARRGNARAAETICVFPLLVGPDQNSAALAWNVCAYATYEAHLLTRTPHGMLERMRNSVWFDIARWAAVGPVSVIQGWTKVAP